MTCEYCALKIWLGQTDMYNKGRTDKGFKRYSTKKKDLNISAMFMCMSLSIVINWKY